MKRLLVVDDEPAVRSLIAASLAGDWDVEAVADGAAALDAVQKSPPDIVLLDVGLPGMSGSLLLERLRAESRTAAVPILYITGLEPLGGPRPDGVLAKPFTPAGLRKALEAWIE